MIRTRVLPAALLVALTFAGVAEAGVFGEGLGGALRGAIVGDLIDGRDGAAAGAVIGGMIGAGEAASRKKQQRRQAEAAQRRRAEWAAAKQAEQERLQQQRQIAAGAEQSSVDQTLLVETQKSLIRLGFDPGDVGAAGSKLTEAITAYQRSKGLLETGQMSQPLLAHMLQNGG